MDAAKSDPTAKAGLALSSDCADTEAEEAVTCTDGVKGDEAVVDVGADAKSE